MGSSCASASHCGPPSDFLWANCPPNEEKGSNKSRSKALRQEEYDQLTLKTNTVNKIDFTFNVHFNVPGHMVFKDHMTASGCTFSASFYLEKETGEYVIPLQAKWNLDFFCENSSLVAVAG